MPTLTPELRAEYERLFNTCVIRAGREDDADRIIAVALQHRDREYQTVSGQTDVPWYIIAVIHSLEASQSFRKHLHNGDSLQRRTVQEPAGRPPTGTPPFTWEESAIDALTMPAHQLDRVVGWTVAETMFQLEKYNGFGYRLQHTGIFSPYLWSFSNHYTRGKFIADHVFSPTAVSDQCGAAVLLRRMVNQGFIEIPLTLAPPTVAEVETAGAAVQFSNTRASLAGKRLQKMLSRVPDISLTIDGVPGNNTSDAFKRVTGHFLTGDPRA